MFSPQDFHPSRWKNVNRVACVSFIACASFVPFQSLERCLECLSVSEKSSAQRAFDPARAAEAGEIGQAWPSRPCPNIAQHTREPECDVSRFAQQRAVAKDDACPRKPCRKDGKACKDGKARKQEDHEDAVDKVASSYENVYVGASAAMLSKHSGRTERAA